MYNLPAFQETDTANIHTAIRSARLANFVTATGHGLLASPLPLFLDSEEGPNGVLYGHLARANPQWKAVPIGEAMAIFMGPDAYVTPSWYQSKLETGKVVPTWNYITVQAFGSVEFFDDAGRLLEVVTRLTHIHEQSRAVPWAVDDAPASYIQSQLRGIVGLRIPISRLEAKRKMSQNKSVNDRAGVIQGLASSDDERDRIVAGFVPG